MADEKLKKKIMDTMQMSVDTWSDFSKRDFKSIIASERFNTVLYSPRKDSGFTSELGVFTFMIQLASNVSVPKTISPKKPLGGNYIEYDFRDGRLKLVRHISDGKLGLSFYVGDDFVVGLEERRSCELNSILLFNGSSQTSIHGFGTYDTVIITDLGDGFCRRESIDPFSYVSSIYELINGKYSEIQVERRALMPLEWGIDFMNKHDPYFKIGYGGGIIKIRTAFFESAKESGWELL